MSPQVQWPPAHMTSMLYETGMSQVDRAQLFAITP